ncbi:hypothetical protein A3A75_05885 [Candidatus Woesebacteria bacterium RIFCSPLOWO2_01_FULL_39_10]|uniref:N-acetyltransferase domain-containing protein n=1 Tax=Candidatus Woesebacteria bacterium RIFCSPLOWO2_01_FULL_39_10 TaxID=1802516 RepID=A0A1F8B821_9BACT|nr:MAG: hypothetical protein A3A75_05885 [Candidatus Woesebacteria bacterium RIFCSPLOWO2_01_FULL_39_10]
MKMVASEGEPREEDFKVLSEGLLAHHAKNGHPRKSEKYSIFLKSTNGKVLGGVIVTFLWNGMEVNSLWVDDSISRQGWGRKLMTAVEEEAVKRGCTIAYINTFSYQAPGFYEKLGYKLYGKLEDFPEGSAKNHFSKRLAK